MNRYREPVTHLSTALLLLALAPQFGGEGPASRHVPSIHAVRFFIAAQDTTPRPGVPVEPESAILDAFDHHNDRPITEAFFRAVREVNASLRPERPLRVLLGDPPIDWDAIESRADHQEWLRLRDTHPAELIRREVLRKERRALVVYGGMHLQRRNLLGNYELVDDPHLHTLVQQLESDGDTRVFTVWPTVGIDLQDLEPDVASWPVPSLAPVHGTALGATDFAAFYPQRVPRAAIRDGRIVPVPRNQWRTLPMEEQFDAVLYLGPSSGMTTSWPAAALCLDQAYMDMRRARLSLLGMQPVLDQLQRRCARVAP